MTREIAELIDKCEKASVYNRGSYRAVTKTTAVIRKNGKSIEEDPIDPPIPPEPTGPYLNATSVTLYTGYKTFQLEVIDCPEGSLVSFESQNTAIATVSNTGSITRKGVGTTSILVHVVREDEESGESYQLECEVTGSAAYVRVNDVDYDTTAEGVAVAMSAGVPVVPLASNASYTFENPTDSFMVKNEYESAKLTVKACANTSTDVYAVKSEELSDGTIKYSVESTGTPDIEFINASEVSSFRAFSVFNSAGTYKFLKDMILPKTIYVDCGVLGGNVTLDLNGHTLHVTSATEKGHASNAISAIDAYRANVTIIGNGTVIVDDDTDFYGVSTNSGKTITIKNGVFNGNVTCLYAQKGTIIVEDGSFEAYPYDDGKGGDPYRFTANCLDANYKAGTAAIQISGGTFKNFNPADNAAEGEHTNFVDEGHTVSYDEETHIYSVT